MTPELSIICVNWNSLGYLLECVATVYEHTQEAVFEVIVVDNASPEGRMEILAERFPRVRIVKSSKNLGFARANNLGFLHSLGDYVLFLNPDTRLVGSAIDVMLGVIKSLPDAGVVGCKLLNSDLSISTSSIQKFPTIVNQLINVEYLRLRYPSFPLWDLGPLFSDKPGPTRVDVIPGACMMLKRDVFQRAGCFSEEYFMYAEDIDLNYKTRKLGLSSYYIGDAQIVHHGGRSSSQQKVSQWSTIMTYKAMVQFYRLNRGPVYGAAYRVAMGMSAAARLMLIAMLFPFAEKKGLWWSAAKWATVFRWAIGIDRPCSNR